MRDGQYDSQHIALFRTIDEWPVSRVRLNLDAQVAVRLGHVDAVRIMLDGEMLSERGFDALDIGNGDDDVEVETDDRLGVRVDPLPADHAKAHAPLAQERQQPAEQIRSV